MALIEKEKKYVIHDNYEITFLPIPDKSMEKLNEEQKERLSNVFASTKKFPEQSIPQLISLTNEFPEIPKIYNYLFNAYINTNNLKEAEATATENYKKNPDYLYARINYAFIKLKNQEFDKIPDIFNNKFDLKALYPDRKTFHINELAKLSDFLSMYYLAIKKPDQALSVFIDLKKIAPIHPLTEAIQIRLNQSKKKG
jgi:tetratricopeptide (TPR) repeat protein